MLSVRADRRPTMARVCAALDGESPPALVADVAEPPFVGRTEERRRLLDAIRYGSAGSLVEVEGPSGVGKTELVRRVLSELDAREALVLRSRCRRAESVPFQALDAVIDDLVVELLQRAGSRSDSQIDADAQTASVLFPSLARLPGVERPTCDFAGDPVERRREAVAALRRLFVAASGARSLVVWIDDAQWADTDSSVLLADLVSGAQAPAVHWILTNRAGPTRSSALAESVLSVSAGRGSFLHERLEIAPLDAGNAEVLVRSVSAGRELSAKAIEEIVRAAAGFPFLLTGMAALDAGTTADSMAGGFAYVLDRSMADLGDDARRVLELVALSRQPTELSLLLEAAEVGNAGVLSIRKLESRRLVRTAPLDAGVVVDSYHDQVPETLLASIGGQRARDGHARLARVHERRASDPAVLSLHFHGAGEMPKAASYAEAAGRQADAALAFARAAEFYRSARTWNEGADRGRRRDLLQREGAALANAGALAAAGECYLQAADETAGHA